MKKFRSNEAGFSVIELLIIIVIIVFICLAGWLVYKDHHKTKASTEGTVTTTTKSITTSTNTTNTANNTTTPLPIYNYTGWETYCSSLANACFKYDPSWTFAECAPAQINMSEFQDCGTEGVAIILSDGTRIGWDVEPYDATQIDNCNPNQHSYPGLTYSNITQVPNTTNLYFVNMHDGYNEQGGYQIDLTLLNGDNGQVPEVGETGSLCPTNSIFRTNDGKYMIDFSASFGVNTNPGQDNSLPSQTDLNSVKQVLLSFYYQ
jgi:hypothetical protein